MRAVGEAEQGKLASVKALLDHHTRACLAQPALFHEKLHGVQRIGERLTHEDSFAQRLAVCLDHHRLGGEMLTQVGFCLFRLVKHRKRCGGHACLRHQLLGERFATFQHRGGAARSKARDACIG
ncbi:MAG: hypothetical protein KatS3mg021_1571 [Fimbriimonadales bacterium]|nr:MAG: hypothetical protein KatS3mg021_1571 [Fimbriimonadales bacterium]